MAVRKDRRKGGNLMSKLMQREVHGGFQSCRRIPRQKVFTKLPGRLCFSLRSLVSESVLEEGHVFLGFTKNGQFVVSYSLQVDADEHTAFPVYVYWLQWWRVAPHQTLRKVGEVRLFGEEAIVQDLYMAFCEWPQDDTKILIHGYGIPSMSDENRECYVTITAVPPITHCSVCHAADVAHPGSKCLKHSFTVHTKYELAPPFPVFSPRVHLKADRIAVFNTGDSLVAFAVDFPNSEPQQTQNPEVVKQCDVESIVHFKPANVVRSSVIGQHMYGTSMSLGKCIVSASPCDMKEPKRGDANCRDMSVYVFSSESEENTPVSSPLQPYEAAESPTSGLCQTCGHNRQAKPLTARGVNCECMQQKQSRNGAGNYDKLSPCLTQRINLKLPPDSPSCRSPSSPLSPPTLSSINTYSKFNENTPENVRTVQSSQRSFFSPSISESGSIASRSTDSVLFHVNESHCVTYSVRKFSHLEGSTESPILMEDDLDLAYRSILPADVHGIDNKPMHLIKSGPSDSWELSVVQLTLDIEHCLEETIRSSAEWGPRYVMFTNYDLQILDVCPVLECILVKAFVLLRAREETTIDKKQKRSKSCVKMYQTSIVFQWDWTSGVCDSVHIEDLSEINEADTRRQKWNPGHKELARLRKETFIPQTFQKSVYVLTNEAVFKGESLKILLAPQVYLAILL